MRPATPALVLEEGQREVLETLARSTSAAHREVVRAKALLLAAEGLANTAIASRLGVSASAVVSWRQRFASDGLAKFAQVRKGRGRKPQIPQAKVDEIVHLTQHSKPEGQTHWSCRTMAKATGVSAATVQRVWHARGLKPHLVETFKLSTDRQFDEKLVDVVGLYMNPPDKAVVLCIDEKSQIQALDRTQPSLPMKKGRAGTMTHDYKRNGTTTLFAALDVLSGKVIGQCLPRHTHNEFLHFLKKVDKEVPKGLAVHVICDNYATHKHPNVKAWLAKNPRFHLHFTPTSSSWLNLVERWFRELTDKAIRRGVFRSVPDLVAAIEDYLGAHNKHPKPFTWTATAEQILEKVRRGRVVLEQITA
ncbi:MAG: IS630 family transposase [Acidimicrobiales bacterium]